MGTTDALAIQKKTSHNVTGIGKFRYLLYLSFLLLLTIYQDFPLKNVIGEIGRSPILLMTPVFVMSELHYLLSKKSIKNATKLQKYIFLFICYLTFVSLIYVYIQFINSNYMFGNENLLIKAVKGLSYIFVICLYVRYMHNVLIKAQRLGVLFHSFFFVFLIIIAIMFIELATKPNALLFLHSSNNPYWRIRLLTSESSTTGTIIIVFSAVILYLVKNVSKAVKSFAIISVITGFFLYVGVTSSKGFIIVLFVTIAIMMLRLLDIRRASNILILLIIICLTIFSYNILADKLINSLQNDLNNYTSMYTRLGSIFVAIVTLIHHPFGVGTGSYVVYFNQYLNTAIDWMRDISLKLLGYENINTSELTMYSNSDKNLAVKSGLFQWVMYGGLGAIYFFLLIIKWAHSIVRTNLILLAAFIFILLSFLFISLEMKYEIWLFLSFIGLYKKDENSSLNK